MTDREKLYKLIDDFDALTTPIDGFRHHLADYIIANGVVVREKGEWVPLGQRTYGGGRCYTHYCRQCGQHGYDDYALCPNCGADMRKGDNG